MRRWVDATLENHVRPHVRTCSHIRYTDCVATTSPRCGCAALASPQASLPASPSHLAGSNPILFSASNGALREPRAQSVQVGPPPSSMGRPRRHICQGLARATIFCRLRERLPHPLSRPKDASSSCVGSHWSAGATTMCVAVASSRADQLRPFSSAWVRAARGGRVEYKRLV